MGQHLSFSWRGLRMADGLRLGPQSTRYLRSARWILGATIPFLLVASSASARPAMAAELIAARTIPPHEVTSAALAPGPVWVTVATWDLGEERLIVPDPGSGRAFLFNLDGTLARTIGQPGLGPLEIELAATAYALGDRYLLSAGLYRWIWVSADFKSIAPFSLEWRETGTTVPYRELARYNSAAGASKLFVLGTLQSHDFKRTGWELFAVPYTDSRVVERLGPLAIDADEDERDLNDFTPKLAACGERLYLLRMSQRLAIEDVGPPRRRLRSFPSSFADRPRLPPLKGPQTVVARLAAMRAARLADGLFCLGDGPLLMLAHQPRLEGGLQWLVYPIDPIADRLGRPIELPTRAGEIVFVPGRRSWAILEKGNLRQVGLQPLTRLLRFANPLSGAGAID